MRDAAINPVDTVLSDGIEDKSLVKGIYMQMLRHPYIYWTAGIGI